MALSEIRSPAMNQTKPMIQLQEVKAAISLAFPGRIVRRMNNLTSGLDFVVYRVDFEDGERVVFRGQRNYVSEYLGPQDFGAILSREIRFYELLPHFPVPRPFYFEPDESRLGFPFAFFTFMSGQPISDLLAGVSFSQRREAMRELGRRLAAIHQVGAVQAGRLARETAKTWAEYMTLRLRRRLTPYLEQGLVTDTELSLILNRASALKLDCPRLLHMDFRPVNMLGEMEEGAIRITGIVDAGKTGGGRWLRRRLLPKLPGDLWRSGKGLRRLPALSAGNRRTAGKRLSRHA
jgi:aminoglycoside phosphotransferase (APT) family kinase protein